MVYQFNPDMLPDDRFRPGELKFLVAGNEGRMLDSRRTPFRLLDVKLNSGFFMVELLDFEDKGARWELTLEFVGHCQFAEGSAEADEVCVALYEEIIQRLDQPLSIPADQTRRAASEARIDTLREKAGCALESGLRELKSDEVLDYSGQTAYPALWRNLERYLNAEQLWDMEQGFTECFVGNPYSGELIKGHRIVLAELGLVSFEGKQVRDPELFAEPWSRERRAEHILHRLAFLRELFSGLGQENLVLYRGLSCSGPLQPSKNRSFVSSTFNREVAEGHFNERDRSSTGLILRQPVPVERVFMTFLETAAMNAQYKEAEAVLFFDGDNRVF